MNLDMFKNHFLVKSDHTIIIDREFEIDGEIMYLLGLTYEKSYTLWVLDKKAEPRQDIVFQPEEQTPRMMQNNRMDMPRFIESIRIGDHVFQFDGSSADSLQFQGGQGLHRLQSLIDFGAQINGWDQVPVDNLRLINYKSRQETPRIDFQFDNHQIEVQFRSYHEFKEAHHQYILDFDIIEPVPLKYTNPYNGEEETFYVESFELYTLDMYLESIKSNDKYKEVPKEHLDKMIETMTNFFEEMEQRQEVLVLMNYETDQNLSFQSTYSLDKPITPSRGSASSMGLIFRPEEKKGGNGSRYTVSFQGLPQDQTSKIAFELVTVAQKHDEKRVILD